ncbi:hypothetical protein BKA70DRAFT_1230665 [Coprinopsis sp. MPI-PUGE-AT-0042]|nr:hypothetical protein BKA70DRAFT_1230665 [Coprinopsis sp. MPI-PUGE-AT-0042]
MTPLRVFLLTSDSPCSCSLIDQETDDIWYTVSTELGKEATKTVLNGTDQVIASWKWREFSSDILTLGSLEPMPASAWLRKSLSPFKTDVSFSGKDEVKYTWKNNDPWQDLELYKEDDETNPIAQFQKAANWRASVGPQDPPVQMHRPATLTLDARGQEIQDLVVISFLILQKQKRAEGKD